MFVSRRVVLLPKLTMYQQKSYREPWFWDIHIATMSRIIAGSDVAVLRPYSIIQTSSQFIAPPADTARKNLDFAIEGSS